MNNRKPLGKKSYGSIPHLPGSRLGPAEHKCSPGQGRIATEKKRDKHDLIIVQEKVDGSNTGVAKINGEILALTRAGYLANTSPYAQHHRFHEWVEKNKNRFLELLQEGERLCGEWMLVAHGTRYILPHEPFIAFDLMSGSERIVYDELTYRVEKFNFIQPKLISRGEPVSIAKGMEAVKESGHGAIDDVEGCVWRVERNKLIGRHSSQRKWIVDFLVKYVRQEKVDGLYLKGEDVYNQCL